MDNNYGQPQRPRKRVTKQMLRRRQFCGVAVIGFVLLVFIVLIAKACSGGGTEKIDPPAVTTTAPATTTVPVITTTTPVTTVNPKAAQVKLSTRALFLDIGETDVSIINAYPEGSSEANEVWTSQDDSIAIVNELGYVTGVAPGETYIILSFDNNPDIEIEIKVTVADGGVSAEVTTSDESSNFPTENAAAVSYTTAAEGFFDRDNENA